MFIAQTERDVYFCDAHFAVELLVITTPLVSASRFFEKRDGSRGGRIKSGQL